MSIEEACRKILRPAVADSLIRELGLKWTIAVAMAAARTSDDPEAIEAIRDYNRKS